MNPGKIRDSELNKVYFQPPSSRRMRTCGREEREIGFMKRARLKDARFLGRERPCKVARKNCSLLRQKGCGGDGAGFKTHRPGIMWWVKTYEKDWGGKYCPEGDKKKLAGSKTSSWRLNSGSPPRTPRKVHFL